MNSNYFSTDFITKLSIPRLVGTEGERAAQRIIEDELTRLVSENYKKQSFICSNFRNNLLRVYDVMLGIFMLFIFIQILLEWVILIYISIIILFLLSSQSRFLKEKISFSVNTHTQRSQSYNYIVNLPAQNKNKEQIKTIVMLAHYDSKSLTLHPIFEGAIYFFGLMGGTIFAIHVAIIETLYVLKLIPLINPLQFIYIFFLILLYCIEFFNKTGNNSPGANDNACGVASGMYLINILKENSLKNTNLTIVFTGAEEIGEIGAYNFIKEYSTDLNEDNTYFLIIDSPGGSSEVNTCIYGQGLPKKSFSEFIESHTRKVIKSHKMLKMDFLYVPPLIPFTTDHTPLKFFGDYEFLIFTSNNRWHSEKDNLENYSPNMLENFFQFLRELIYEIDLVE